ncbi:amino acid ABC transporter permease [Planosporangium mesophilum]|uniref:Amino acid ABC transporter permease n=1 Tax=Planosporangium mesophilum TaxID=689768 RepID=A0A8J3T5B7_9ACTN|nr:amino acid ABC transporter permease [Planosporangium mesophilum]GII20548.1 amino acid ABC transporter permease [Planosporangium mesophilum]
MNTFLHTLTDNGELFWRGFKTTIELFLISAIGSLVLGTLLAAARVSPVPILRAVGMTYVQVLRNTPLTLIFAFLVFAGPKLDIGLEYFPSACVALIAYTSAFICEVVRAGVNTVSPGQAEAARALGMTFPQVTGQIVLPQAFRSIVPPLMSVLIAMLKNTTIAAGFSVVEAGAIPQYMSERGENQFATLIWIVIGFLLLIAPLVTLQRTLERKWGVAR